ncbi:MAG: dephospho-CoA kinase [Cyanobium sp. LacPavin_0920_WC12_MAG_62_9]|nr:dephospho-CoA kinase [Cyanobium sp. LacPavin_0920_WC12_MAG_62_9]
MAESLRWPGSRWQGPQRRIGLTGGIATGKSTVGQLLQEHHGLPVLDADLFARQALAPGTEAARVVLERYGTLDRPALGHIVFGDPAERHWLEQLVHPLVRQRFDQELTTLAEQPVGASPPAVVLMIPLLFEAGLEGLCSEVWLVDCDEHQQLARLMARNGLTQAEAQGRINAQWPLERKRLLADRTISNRGNPEELARVVAGAVAADVAAEVRAAAPQKGPSP